MKVCALRTRNAAGVKAAVESTSLPIRYNVFSHFSLVVVLSISTF